MSAFGPEAPPPGRAGCEPSLQTESDEPAGEWILMEDVSEIASADDTER
jgi:hypothetical protein